MHPRKAVVVPVPEPEPVVEWVDHPAHYGGEDDLYEAIKVIDAWELGYNLGNVLKYIRRGDAKGGRLQNLRKGLWFMQHEIDKLETDEAE